MGAPPLAGSILDLAEAVNTIAEQHGLNPTEHRAALEILGGIIGTGETSHVRCLQRVADAIEHERHRLAEIAAEYSTRDGAGTYRGTGPKAAPQEELRWDQQ